MLKLLNNISAKYKKIFLYFILFFFFNIIFFIFSRNYFAENGVFLKYLQSILNDGDFNIFNQFSNPLDQWMSTATYNHPDYHSPFISALLIVPYAYFKIFIGSVLEQDNLGYQLFFTLSLGVIIIRQGYLFEENHNNYKENFLFYLLFFTTAAICQTFVDPTELSLTCLIFSLIIYFEFNKILTDKKYSSCVLGLAIGLLSLIKPDGLFYAVPILTYFIFNKEMKRFFNVLFIFLICQAQLFLVNYLRFGEININNPVILTDYFYLYSYLLGPNGLFIKNPFACFILIAMTYQLFNAAKSRDRVLMAIGISVMFLKFIALSFDFSPVTNTIASRHIITEIPIMAHCLLLFSKKYKTALILILSGLILYNFYDLYSFFLHNQSQFAFNYFFTKILPIKLALNHFYILTDYIHWKIDYIQKNVFMVIQYSFLSSIFLSAVFFIQEINPNKFRQVVLFFIFGMCITFSSLNLYFNKKNVLKMQTSDIFKKTVVTKGVAIYYDEVMDIINLVDTASMINGVPDKKEIKKFQDKYIEKVQNNIVYDPTSFSEDLKKGIIRKSFWQLK